MNYTIETIRKELIKADRAMKVIKVNTLYLKLIERHQEAINTINKRLQLDVQSNISMQLVLDATYLEIEKDIAKIKLQLLFLKS